MSDLKEMIKGGGFVVEDLKAEDIITPEDFTDEHLMIAKTTEDFVVGEVVPKIDQLENHEFEHSVALLKKAGELGLLGADVPEEYGGLQLDKISSSLLQKSLQEPAAFPLHTGLTWGLDPFQSCSSVTTTRSKSTFLHWL